jgi:hypothetical protein
MAIQSGEDGGVSCGSNARPPGLEEVVVEEAAEHEDNDAVQHHQADLNQGVQRVQISCSKASNFYNLKRRMNEKKRGAFRFPAKASINFIV